MILLYEFSSLRPLPLALCRVVKFSDLFLITGKVNRMIEGNNRPVIGLSSSTQLNRYFINIFFRYFSLKNYSIMLTIKELFKQNYRKNLIPKITRLIKSSYLT